MSTKRMPRDLDAYTQRLVAAWLDAHHPDVWTVWIDFEASTMGCWPRSEGRGFIKSEDDPRIVEVPVAVPQGIRQSLEDAKTRCRHPGCAMSRKYRDGKCHHHTRNAEVVKARAAAKAKRQARTARRKIASNRRVMPVQPGELLNLRLRDVLALQVATAVIASLNSPEDPI